MPPPDSDRGSLALRRLNFIHSQYKISNDDYLYVLALFILEPQRWIHRYGFRDLTTSEKIANFATWQDVGVWMGIKDIPEDLEVLEKRQVEYEMKNMVYAESNRKVADIPLALLLSKLPRFTWPFVRCLTFAMLDDQLRTAVGYPEQPKWFQSAPRSFLKFCMRSCISMFHPPRPLAWSVDRISINVSEQGKDFSPEKSRNLSFDRYGCSYPNGYKIAELGPFKPDVLGAIGAAELLCPL